MNSTLFHLTRIKSTGPAAFTRQTAELMNKEKKIMKLKIQFGEETRFDVLPPPAIKTWAQLLPGMRLSLHALAMAERSKPARCRAD